jgi:hypothetical protein
VLDCVFVAIISCPSAENVAGWWETSLLALDRSEC